MPAVRLHWYDGGIVPPRPPELEPGRDLSREDGLLFVGDKGTMYVEGWGGETPRLIPESKMQAYQRPPKTLPRSIGHHQEWIKACKEGTPTRSNFPDFAGPLTEAVLLGTVCVRMGGPRLALGQREPEGDESARGEPVSALRVPQGVDVVGWAVPTKTQRIDTTTNGGHSPPYDRRFAGHAE